VTLFILREKLIKYFEDYRVINYIYNIGNKSFAICLNQLETHNVLRICLKRNSRLDIYICIMYWKKLLKKNFKDIWSYI